MVFFFSTGYHTAIACSDSDVVCTMDALIETFLSPTPAQHQKARGKRRTLSVVDIIILLGFRLSCTCDCRLSERKCEILSSFAKEILAM